MKGLLDRDRGLGVPLLFACGLSLVLAAVIWLVDYIPANDGPNAIVHGYLTLHLDDPQKGYAHFLKRSQNVTGLGFGVPFSVLLHVLSWQDALRVTSTLGALLWAWGYVALIAAIEPRRLALSAFGFATALSWSFYMGFYPYWIAGGLALLVLSFAIASKGSGVARLLVIGGGALLVVLAHSFVGMLLGVLLVVLTLVRSAGLQRLEALSWLGLAGAPAMLVAAFSGKGSDADLVSTTIRDDPLGTTWLSLTDTLAMPARCFGAGPLWRGAVPPLLALVGLGLAAVRARRGQLSENDRALTWSAALALILSVALPFNFQLWNFFSPRFVPFWVMLGIALLPVERIVAARSRLALNAACAVFALAALGWSAKYHLELAAHDADAIALASAPVHRTGTRLPLNLTTPLPGIAYDQPGLNLPMLYVIAQGGMVPDLFATRAGIHPHLYRAPPEKLFPKFPGRFYGDLFRAAGSAPQFPPKPVQLTWLALLGAAYDDVILISEVADADAFIAHGYAVDQRRGKAAIVHYTGCGLEVAIVSPEPPTVPLIVEYGWSPILKSTHQIVLPPGSVGRAARASFPDAPCGPVWVRVTWDNDRSGNRSGTDTYCKESGKLSLIDTTISQNDNRVTCTAPAGPEPAGENAPKE